MFLSVVVLAGCRQNLENAQEKNANECILKAKDCIANNQPRDAIRILEEGMRVYGNVSEITELLASVYLSTGDDELAAFYFEQTAGLSDLRYHCYLKAAEIYEKKQDWDQACLCYKWYLEVLSEDTEIQIKYAMVLLKSGQKKKALKLLILYANESVDICNLVATLFFDAKNYLQACNWFLSTLAVDKNNLFALNGLWEIYLLFKDLNGLLDVGTQLLALGEKSVKGIDIQSIVDAIRLFQRKLNELENIKLDLKKIVLPQFFLKTIELNASLSSMGQLATPAGNISKGEEKELDKIATLKNSVDKARLRGDYDEAISILWKILSIDGKNVDIWAALTGCLQKVNKYDIAEMAIQEAIKIKPECIDFYMTYLDIVLCSHSSTDYVRLLKDVIHTFPENPEGWFRWANAQEMYISDAIGAKHSYEKFLDLAPVNHPEIPKVKHLLQTYEKIENGKQQ
ncbi:MAG: tetratricopeptide repeat protein [Puniceicoccales bacterium]|jgi:tetratricopeptide (TPR) repeat protein|nr:tetratricopeptide repeat protein [Puniceicoccales bacterium]